VTAQVCGRKLAFWAKNGKRKENICLNGEKGAWIWPIGEGKSAELVANGVIYTRKRPQAGPAAFSAWLG